jgi:hypothetical protein
VPRNLAEMVCGLRPCIGRGSRPASARHVRALILRAACQGSACDQAERMLGHVEHPASPRLTTCVERGSVCYVISGTYVRLPTVHIGRVPASRAVLLRLLSYLASRETHVNEEEYAAM